MNKSLALFIALLIAVPLVIGLSSAAATPDEFVIPLDKYVNFSNNLTVYLNQLTVSNLTYGGAYSADPMNTTWPVLLFHYENHGLAQVACRLHVQLVDNASAVYDKTDVFISEPIYPGQVSTLVTLEMAIPNGRTITKLILVDDAKKKVAAELPIVYPTPTPTPTPTPAPGMFDGAGDSLRNLLLIPILLGLVGLIGWFMARKRLF